MRVPTPKPSIKTQNCNTHSSNARIDYDISSSQKLFNPVLTAKNLSDCNLDVSISATGVCMSTMRLTIPLQLQYNLRPREVLLIDQYTLQQFFPFAECRLYDIRIPISTYATFALEYPPTIFINSSN